MTQAKLHPVNSHHRRAGMDAFYRAVLGLGPEHSLAAGRLSTRGSSAALVKLRRSTMRTNTRTSGPPWGD